MSRAPGWLCVTATVFGLLVVGGIHSGGFARGGADGRRGRVRGIGLLEVVIWGAMVVSVFVVGGILFMILTRGGRDR